MKKRKYLIFIFEDGEGGHFESNNWHLVFASYNRSGSATIYGLPSYDGSIFEVVMSK